MMKLMRAFGWGTCWVHGWDSSWWCWYILTSHSWWVVDTWLVQLGTCLDALVHGTGWLQFGAWLMHLLWHRLITGWCMVDALVYGTGWLHVGAWLMHLFMVQVDYRLITGWGTGWYMVDAWFRFIGIGLQRYISQWKCDSSSIILLLLQGGRMGQGHVVVATFRL